MTTDLIENHLMTLLKSPKDQEIDDSYEEAILKREPYAFVAPTMPPVVVTDMRMHRKFTDPTSL